MPIARAGRDHGAGKRFLVELVKPSHYDDDGYLIQWWRAWIPSNSLACLYGLTLDVAEHRALGDDVRIEATAHDECHTRVPVRAIIARIQAAGGHGLVCLVGVQSNQFPRALDIARRLRAAGIQVAIGGFHVSGCMAMLPELPTDLQQALDMGVTLFAGEAEGRLGTLYADAYHGRLKPVYNYLHDLPDMAAQPAPFLPEALVRRYAGSITTIDTGRGCPFTCSFCTIINVQGRRSRYRDADDVERLVRANAARGIYRYFITDDNFARNKNWEAIFDRLIELRTREGIGVNFLVQVDTLAHKIPGFVEKAARAGCKKAFVGLENINPDNLKAANKRQNRITEYRRMAQAWRNAGIVTYCGYILGFPDDTPQSIERDVDIIKRELPVDMLEFFILTPLPGSADHRDLHAQGAWLDPDMNIYDLEHVTTTHPTMSKEALTQAYHRVWDQYYSPAHIETLLRRGAVSGVKPKRLVGMVFQFYGMFRYEKVHPLQGGFWRRKARRERRPGFPRENPAVFYSRRLWEILSTYVPGFLFYLRLRRTLKRILADPATREYQDLALAPVVEAEDEHLEMYEGTEAARAAVAKAAQARARSARPPPESVAAARRAAS